jgi:hypothetical protein
MPLLKYFLTVGAALTVGLLVLSAYLEPTPSDTAAKVSAAPTTASVLNFAAPASAPVKKSK